MATEEIRPASQTNRVAWDDPTLSAEGEADLAAAVERGALSVATVKTQLRFGWLS